MPNLDLEELKLWLAEADDAGDDIDPAIYTAFRNALPELITRVERAEKERDRLKAERDEDRRVFAALTGDTPNV